MNPNKTTKAALVKLEPVYAPQPPHPAPTPSTRVLRSAHHRSCHPNIASNMTARPKPETQSATGHAPYRPIHREKNTEHVDTSLSPRLSLSAHSTVKPPTTTISSRKRKRPPSAVISSQHTQVANPVDIEDACTPDAGMGLGPSPKAVVDLLRASGLVFEAPSKSATARPLLDALFSTILSQATTNINSSRAFHALKQRFSDGGWEAAYRAGPAEIEDAIRCAGLAKRKAARMHEILGKIQEEYGIMSLEALRGKPVDEVKAALTKYNGVGPKTAACVCMFNLEHSEFAVDTHVCRISSRLGWTEEGTSPEAAYVALNHSVPDELKYTLHVQLVEHGRRTCKARAPNCEECPLASICPSASQVQRKHTDVQE